ncbi:amidase [Streptomyces sp. AV19]|uniref:amidase n=1 Tax=Streptomyces sp. AV19 TaxID=2793068 RepID=UPI00241370C6|nr:amidase [Streptomyces sp. AV19]MDG4534314.1 amidase [Streptomyces sp. AV19]
MTGLVDQARQVAEGEVSARELTEAALDAAERTRDTLNAFRWVRAEEALREADEADRLRAAGERRPLLGVPVAVKDDMDVAGLPTAFGCAGEFPPRTADGAAVQRLRAAGAVIVGKTNTPELGQWPMTEGPAFGVTRNPWNPGHTPGGSSGGSAAAVAAGIVAGALGSDGAGSVRIPAAWTHLVGVKPQRGRVPTWPERELFNGLTCHGVLTRSVADAALLLGVVGGPPVDVHKPRRLRIALSLRPAYAAVRHRLEPAVRAATERTAEQLEALGHEIVPEDPRYGPVGPAFVPRAMAGVRELALRVPDPRLLDPRTHRSVRGGRLLGGGILRLARAAERPLRARLGELFGRYDVLLTPTTAAPPLPVGALDGLSAHGTDTAMITACPYTWPWNVLGWPAVNVPAGLTAGGLPLGAQLLGPAGSEPLLLSLAGQLEAEARWFERWPAQGLTEPGRPAPPSLP